MLPYHPPPADLLHPLPGLPSPERLASWSSHPNLPYVLSTHIIPAAYLRSSPKVELPITPADVAGDFSKEERARMVSEAESKLRELRRQSDADNSDGYPEVLWICLNRYVRQASSTTRGLTMFLAHANGFNKETWEPFLTRLLSTSAGQAIDEVWAWESVHHGDSALLNAGKLSSLSSWWDGCRDILNFIICYLPSTVTFSPLPLHLQAVNSQERVQRERNGFEERTLITVGHSFGGCICALSATLFPRLFSALILVDPVIIRPLACHGTLAEVRMNRRNYSRSATRPINKLALGALGRRNGWESKQKAMKQFLRSPFFRAWHPEALKAYVEYGLYKCQDSQVKLKTHPLYEALLFSETHTGSEDAWINMINVDEEIEIKWIVPDEKKPQLDSRAGSTQERVWLRPINSSNVRVAEAGHLIVQEAPQALANEVEKFLQQKYLRPFQNSHL